MSTIGPVSAFDEFIENLNYAQSLVETGKGLAGLRVGLLKDVGDLYRAAWLQSVAGLDHWITREITERAVYLALRPDLTRPQRFWRLEIPVDAFERVQRGEAELGEALLSCWGEKFARMTHQSPERIREGLSYVAAGDIWLKVAEILTRSGDQMTADQVRHRLRVIVDRRNSIAHTADRNPTPPPGRRELTAEETLSTIEWLRTMGGAIHEFLGGPLSSEELLNDQQGSSQPTLPRRRWDEESLLSALTQYCAPDLRDVLLAVYRHAETHPAFRGYSFGAAQYPSVSASFRVGQNEASVWSIYTGSDKSVLSINFEWMHAKGFPVQRLAQLVEALTQMPGAESVLAGVATAGYAKRPSLTPEMLVAGSDVVIRALDDLLATVEGFRFMPKPLPQGEIPVLGSPLEQRLVDAIAAYGFSPSHVTKKKLELVNPDRGQIVYLDREKISAGTIAVVVPAWSNLDAWRADVELIVPVPGRYFHSSNLRAFPRRRNRGDGEIPYGYSVVCRSEEAYQRLIKQV